MRNKIPLMSLSASAEVVDLWLPRTTFGTVYQEYSCFFCALNLLLSSFGEPIEAVASVSSS